MALGDDDRHLKNVPMTQHLNDGVRRTQGFGAVKPTALRRCREASRQRHKGKHEGARTVTVDCHDMGLQPEANQVLHVVRTFAWACVYRVTQPISSKDYPGEDPAVTVLALIAR